MCLPSKSAEMLARENCASIVLLRQQAAAVSGARCSGFHKCKSCDRAFDSFQALGGHRASHKKIRSLESKSGDAAVAPAARLKVHECRQCRNRFPTGQALGGHMRKHADWNVKRKRAEDDENVLEDKEDRIQNFPILRETKICKRTVLQLDLNFPPPMEDDRSFLQLACVGF